MSDTARQPWERLSGEPDEKFEAFGYFVGLEGGRTVRKVAEIVGKSYSTVSAWAKEWSWRARASARDDQMAAEISARELEEKLEARRRRRENLGELQDIGMTAARTEPLNGAEGATVALRSIKELREEYGDNAAQRVEFEDVTGRDEAAPNFAAVMRAIAAGKPPTSELELLDLLASEDEDDAEDQ